jgi:hypothetical protein
MEKSLPDKISIKVRKTPMLFGYKDRYRLSDFSYGEWIIYERGEPRYYFCIFDDLYSEIRNQLTPDTEAYLTRQFKKHGVSLTLNAGSFGIPLHSKSLVVELRLDKLPLQLLV